MKRLAWMLAAFLAVATTAACGSSTDSSSCNYTSTFMTNVQGNWLQCAPSQATAGKFAKIVLGVSCLNATFTYTDNYNDATCTTGTVVSQSGTGTVVIGDAVPNTNFVGGPPPPAVTANKLDVLVNLGGSPYVAYTLGYISTTDTPNRLYVGDFAVVSANRPTQLFPVFYFTKQ